MNEQIIELDQETFEQIYKNENLRNEVASAHGVCDSNGNLEYKKAMMYPISYKVTDEQIKEADALRIKRCKEILKENRHNLLFCGMGMEFEPKTPDGIGNHRIRTEFINSDGVKCFIELGTNYEKGKEDNLRIDFAIFNYCEGEKLSIKEKDAKQQYNYKKLETETPILKYTYENVLKLVNEYFNCNFKKIVVDYYNISCDRILCKSPKNKLGK